MTSLVSSVVELLTTHPHVAYLAVFVLALSESIPIIGVVVPGTAVILALSTLVPSGVLVLWPLLIAAVLGATVGDGLSFWLGHRYHREILGLWPLNRHPELIQRSEAFSRVTGTRVFFLHASHRASAPSFRSSPTCWGCRSASSMPSMSYRRSPGPHRIFCPV